MKGNKAIHYIMIGQLKAIKIAYLKKFTNTKPNIACPVQKYLPPLLVKKQSKFTQFLCGVQIKSTHICT